MTATDSQIKLMKYSDKEYPLQTESYQIIGICMEVHSILGKGLLYCERDKIVQYE